METGSRLLFDVGRELPSLWGPVALVWFGMMAIVFWGIPASTGGFSRRRKAAEAAKPVAMAVAVLGMVTGLLITVGSIVELLQLRQALRSGTAATQEGPVHGFDATRVRGHEPRFSVGAVQFEVPYSLTQSAPRIVIRDGVLVRVTYVDPPIKDAWAGPTVLRIEQLR